MDDGKKRPRDGANETPRKAIEAESDVENYRDEYERAAEHGRAAPGIRRPTSKAGTSSAARGIASAPDPRRAGRSRTRADHGVAP